jgi:tetratricopeptide (TPR) repeat protein
MQFPRRFLVYASLLLATGSVDCFAQMSGRGQMGGMHGPAPEASADDTEAASESDVTNAAYKAGVAYISKAKEADSELAGTADDRKKAKTLAKANSLYSKALDKFLDAVDKDPGLADAWNDIGLCDLHLGTYDEAVSAYAKAVELKPGYSEAYQNRAKAYLALNKISDAKSDYMTLARITPTLADQLLAYMRQWIDERQRDPKGVDSADLTAFTKWTDERATSNK